MEKIRCLVADIPHVLLSDIIQEFFNMQPEIDVVGCVNGENNLIEFIQNNPVDVLLKGMERNENNQIFDEIFKIMPQISIVGIIDDGRRICHCVEGISPGHLLGLVSMQKSLRTIDIH